MSGKESFEDEVRNRFEGLASIMREKFKGFASTRSIVERLEAIEEKLEKMNDRLGEIEKRVSRK
jgi:hypothetical protein